MKQEQNKYQTLKRIGGLLTAPISGSLSKKVKENIFGEVSRYYKSPVGYVKQLDAKSRYEQISDAVSMLGNGVLGAGFLDYSFQASSDERGLALMAGAYGAYKIAETTYRFVKSITNNIANTCPGSLEGTLLSKALIEPFLKNNKKNEKLKKENL
jgi:hypothetical protein